MIQIKVGLSTFFAQLSVVCRILSSRQPIALFRKFELTDRFIVKLVLYKNRFLESSGTSVLTATFFPLAKTSQQKTLKPSSLLNNNLSFSMLFTSQQKNILQEYVILY